MKNLKSIIYYDRHKVESEIDVAEDCIENLNNLAPLIIKTDLNLHRGNYKVVFGHGAEGWIYDGGEKILPMKEASKKYDMMISCNNHFNKDIWKPQEGTRLSKGTYGVGKIHLGSDYACFLNYDGTQNPKGFTFFIGGNPFFNVRIEGNYQYGNRDPMFSEGINVLSFCNEKNIQIPDNLINVTNIQDLSEIQDLDNKNISSPVKLVF